jgi:hypothetical protein
MITDLGTACCFAGGASWYADRLPSFLLVGGAILWEYWLISLYKTIQVEPIARRKWRCQPGNQCDKSFDI